MPQRFPLFVDLSDKVCLVVGAGPVALRRTRALLNFGAYVHVVAPQVLKEFYDLPTGRLVLYERPFATTDLENVYLCIVATNVSVINQQIAQLAAQKRVWVNVASDANLGDFHFPALVQHSNFVLGLHAGGKPALAKRLRIWLDQIVTNFKDAE